VRATLIFALAFAAITHTLFGLLSPVREVVSFNIPRGASVSKVAEQLKAGGIIYSETLFKISIQIMGGQIKSGGYDIGARTSVWRVASMMSRGRVATIAITIPEGFTIKQIENRLNENEFLTGVVACITCPIYGEGELFPDTYRVAKWSDRGVIMEMAKKKMDGVRENYAKTKLPEPLKDWNDVLTLASIVQKETPLVSEMPMVAGVYLNRLRINMPLQADPTVVYGITDKLGDMQGKPVLRSHLQNDHAHNTYTNYGLPPTPIANPGRAAIDSVLHPMKTDYLYFVADGSGGHVFAQTYDQHQANVANWRAIRK
jgi:UPF0755 protein